MSYWNGIACIVFVAVTANHLGLVKAIEDVFDCKIPIVNCPKCLSCWTTLIYSLFTKDIITALAISFLCSYLALWLELIEGFIDFLYLRIYEKIYPDTNNDTASPVRHEGDTDGTVS